MSDMEGLKKIEDTPSGMVRCGFCGANKVRILPCGECGKIARPSRMVVIITASVATLILLVVFITSLSLNVFDGSSHFRSIRDNTNKQMKASSDRTMTVISNEIAKGTVTKTQVQYLAKQSTDMVTAIYYEGYFEMKEYAGKSEKRKETLKPYDEELKVMYKSMIDYMNKVYDTMIANL